MSATEQQIQRDGYVNAFRHPDVVRAIALGPHGRIAVLYMEWAGPKFQHVTVPWTIIGGDAEAERFANALARKPIVREAATSISSGLLRAEDLFAHSQLVDERRVIDVSGDGPNNAGPPIASVRDELVDSGISINGLPMSLDRGGLSAFGNFEPSSGAYLESYYENCVIGGPDAFVIWIDDMSQFEVAVRRRLVREIVGQPARTWLTSSRPRTGPVADCSALGEVVGQ